MTTTRAHGVLGYLRAGVEADHAAVEHLPLDTPSEGASSLLLERGVAPLADGRTELAPSNRAGRWAEARARAAGTETVWVGWPVVRGQRRVAGRPVEVVAGLIIGQVDVVDAGTGAPAGGPPAAGTALVPRGRSVELGDEALDLLGYPPDERELLRRDFDRALNRGRGDTFAAAVRFLDARGVTTVPCDPRALGPLDRSHPLSNTAVAWVGQAADAAATNGVLHDLARLTTWSDEELGAGPLGLVLAAADPPPAAPPPFEPVPGVAPLDVHQEAAVAGALHRPLSVVTAPAGLARTDLIANTVAAALARGERVLVASANERALDAVAGRLAGLNAWSTPVPAGQQALPGPATEAFDRALRHTVDPHRSERYPTWWAVRADIESPYQTLARRRELTWQLDEITRRRSEVEATLPGGVRAEGDARRLTAALEPASALAGQWAALPRGRPWHLPRLRATERALDQALEEVFAALDGPVGELARLRHDTANPLGALELAATVLAVLDTTDEIGMLVDRLSALPDEATLVAEIEDAYPLRSLAAAQLHEDRWADLLDASPRLRGNLQRYRTGLAAPDDAPDPGGDHPPGGAPAGLHALVPDVLAVLPVWVAPTAALARWLPLSGALFDLVILDDAGRSDIASSLPALARARRALVIGDTHQLAHMTHVTTDLDAQLAAAHGLTEDDHRRFSQRRGSLLSLATRAAGGPPSLLPVAAGIHPDLVELVGRLWYGSRLRAGGGARPLPGPTVRWIDHQGQFEAGRDGRSGRNASEALAVVDEVLAQLADLRAAGTTRPPPAEGNGEAATNGAGPRTDPGAERGTASGGTAAGSTVDASGDDIDADADSGARWPARAGAVAAPVIDLRAEPVRSIGVIAMLAAQRDALHDLLLERFGRSINVDTPETFQGDERDVVVVSLVVGEGTRQELVELVADDARLAVALAAARSRLVVVGDRDLARRSGTRLAEAAEAIDGVGSGAPAPAR